MSFTMTQFLRLLKLADPLKQAKQSFTMTQFLRLLKCQMYGTRVRIPQNIDIFKF